MSKKGKKEQVRALINKGTKYKDISKELGISVDTVKYHVKTLDTKYDNCGKLIVPERKACAMCNKTFESYYESQKYCSDGCRAKSCYAKRKRRAPQKKPSLKACACCGKQFKATVSHHKYCGSKCRNNVQNAGRKLFSLTCGMCGKTFLHSVKTTKFCSRKCLGSSRRNTSLFNEISKLRSEGKSYLEVAEALGKTRWAIMNFCKYNGIGGILLNKERNQSEAEAQFNSKYPNFKFVGNYTGSDGNIDIRCRTCGYEFAYKAQCLKPSRKHNIQCPNCNKHYLGVKKSNKVIEDLNALALDKYIKNLEKAKKKKEQKESEIERKRNNIMICAECGRSYSELERGKKTKYCSSACARRATNEAKDRRLYRCDIVDSGITLKKLDKRDKGICHICGNKVDWKDFIHNENGHFIVGENYPSLDHVVPIAQGGNHTWDNIKLAHHRCNTIKRDNLIYAEGSGQMRIAGM